MAPLAEPVRHYHRTSGRDIMEDAISEGRGEQEAALSDDDTITRDTPSMVTGSNTTASELTKADRDGRLLALENRIGLTPHTTKDLLSILDEAVGWDVNRAEAFFHRWQADRRNRRSWQDGLRTDEEDDISEPKSPNYKTSTEDVLGPVYLGGYTIDEHFGNADYERREAVCTFADIVLRRYDILLSRSEAALALALASWNLERAVGHYSDSDSVDTTGAALSTFFDRTRMPPSRHTDTEDAQSERDTRLALLLTYTGYPSWYSAQLHLTKYGDDLVKAMAGWLRDGIEPIAHKRDKPRKRGEGCGRRLNFDGQYVALPEAKDTFRRLRGDDDRNWAVKPEAFMSEEKKATIDISSLQKTSTGSWKFPIFGKTKKRVKDDKGVDKTRRPGGVINYDVEPPRVGAPDWTKSRFEYIYNGRHFNVPWNNNKQLLAERGENRTVAEGGTRHQDDERTDVFDRNDKEMVGALRKWRSQKMGRVTRMNLREAGLRLSVEEKRFLKQLVDDAFARHRLQNPGRDDTELKKTFCISSGTKQEWEKKWNARFAGKTVASAFDPRRARSAGNLFHLAKLWRKLCELYGLTFNVHANPTDTNMEQWPWEVEEDEDAETDNESGGD